MIFMEAFNATLIKIFTNASKSDFDIEVVLFVFHHGIYL